ncbi:MAG: hypothetical protein IPH95_13185 [Candidatus Promineofilum sp.]|jgi:hypothetical protein|nr:hypothetical protein [Promineifilum sp.]
MPAKPHIIRIVAAEARRQYYALRRPRADLPRPRIWEGEIGVEFDDGRFIPYADLGYHDDVGFFRLSEESDVVNQAAPFAASGRLIDCGQVVVTTGVSLRLTGEEIGQLLARHAGGDFGAYGEFYDLDVSDEMLREEAAPPQPPGLVNKVNTLTGLNPIVSAYSVRDHAVWVITEAGEKQTTVLIYAGSAAD